MQRIRSPHHHVPLYRLQIAYSMGMPEAAINFLILPWAIYSTVGIWRSSDKYKGSKFWAVLTKILIVIGVISYFSGLITATT